MIFSWCGITCQTIVDKGCKTKIINSVLDHDAALLGYTGPGTTCANEMNLGIMPLVQDRPLDLMTSSPVRYNCTADATGGYKTIKHSVVIENRILTTFT